MAFTRPWDNAVPADTQAANLLGQNIRRDKEDTAERLRAFGAGKIANRETPEADFGNVNIGAIFWAEDEGKLYRWTGSAWTLVTTNRVFSDTSQVNITGATTGPGNQVTIPANFLTVGSVVEVIARAYKTAGSGTGLRLNLKFGTDVQNPIAQVSLEPAVPPPADEPSVVRAEVIITGSSAEKIASMGMAGDLKSGSSLPFSDFQARYADLTQSIASSITIQTELNTNAGANTVRFDMLVVKVTLG